MPENSSMPKDPVKEPIKEPLEDVTSAAPAQPVSGPTPPPIVEGDPDAKLVLIAEDDPFISRMYQIKLEGAGLKVIINMPELSGLEVLSALQNDNFDFSVMPVIVLTNSSELSDRNTAHSYGAEYLVKAELTPREVLNMISEKLGIEQTPKAE
jgi:DNA-binding NarL/FixJ family response regulator